MGRKIAALLLLPMIVAMLGVASLLFLYQSPVLERTICRALEESLEASVSLEKVEIGLFSGIELHGLRIVLPGETDPVVEVRSILLDGASASLLSGRITPRSLTFVEPILSLKQDGKGVFSLERFFQEHDVKPFMRSEPSGEEEGPSALVILNGLVKLQGEGPLPARMKELLAPGVELWLGVPSFHGMRAGPESPDWSFNGLLGHEAFGEVRFEGLVGRDGLKSLGMILPGVELQGGAFLSHCSEEARSLLRRNELTGTVTARLDGALDQAGQWKSSLWFRGFDLRPEAFPVSLRGVEGRATLAGRTLRLEEATAEALQGAVCVEATVDLSEDWACRFTIFGEKIPFCSELEKGLEMIGGGRDYRAFDPEGEADITYQGRVSKGQGQVKGFLLIEPRGASASYNGYVDPITGHEDAFPYRVYGLRGRIRVEPAEKVEIESVEGYTRSATDAPGLGSRLARGRLLINGQVGTNRLKHSTDLRIMGSDFLYNEKLKSGLKHSDPGTASFLETLHLAGRFDFDARITDSGKEKPETKLEVLLKDMSIRYEEFPYPIDHIRGDMTREGEVIRFSELKGEHEGGEVTLDGVLRDGHLERLRVTGGGQRITRRLKDTMKTMLPEGYGFLWDMDYEGALDLSLEFEEGNPHNALNVELGLHMDRLAGDPLPVPLEDVTGTVLLNTLEGRIQGRDIAFRSGGGKITLDTCEVRTADDLLVLEIKGRGDNLALGTDLSGLLEEEALAQWAGLGSGGGIDLKAFSLAAEIEAGGPLQRLESEIKIRLNGGRLAYPVEIMNIHGDLALHLKKGGAGQAGFVLEGRTEGLSFLLKDRLFTDTVTDFTLDGQALTFARFQSSFYGGRISGSGEKPLTLGFTPPGRFAGSLKVEDGDLKYILDRSSYAFRNVAGKVTGSLSFAGEVDHPHRTRGEGEVAVRKGSLFELPIIGDLSRLMGNIFATEPPTFMGGKARFVFKGGTVTLSDLELESTLMRLKGDGIVALDGVDLNFIPATNIVPDIPILGSIVDLLKDGLIAFKIFGPYSDMKVSYDPLVNRLFSKDRLPGEMRYPGRIPYRFSGRF